MLKDLFTSTFWKSALRLTVFFFLFLVVLSIIFYWIALPFEEFTLYLTSEVALRKLLFIALFSPVYGILVSSFRLTVKKIKGR